MEVFDVELLKKRVGENEGICRVEPTIQDVRAAWFFLLPTPYLPQLG